MESQTSPGGTRVVASGQVTRTGHYAGANISSWPIGVTIINNKAAGSCYNVGTNAYTAGFVDRLNIIATDANKRQSSAAEISPVTYCVDTTDPADRGRGDLDCC
jgi:hypothetical protein